MNDPEERKKFAAELESRVQALAQWAVENWPDKNHPVSAADFNAACAAFVSMTRRLDAAAAEARTPSEGGAQFVGVAPAPWP